MPDPTHASQCTTAYVCHPDFEYAISDDRNIPQLVLGPEGKPVLNTSVTHSTIHSSDTYRGWFFDTFVNGTLTNYSYPLSINVTLTNDPTCTTSDDCDKIYSYKNDAYFPINDMGFGNYWNGENFHFVVS
jgi:hypothetical protein